MNEPTTHGMLQAMTRYLATYGAYCELLALPDEPSLLDAEQRSLRQRRYVQAGDPLRRDGLKRDLERAYSMYRVSDAGRLGGSIVSVRRYVLEGLNER